MGRTTISDFYCTLCGSKGIPIVRKNGEQREAGHLKKLFCLKCKRETNHIEIRPFGKYTYEDFLFEFENGNFNEDGQRNLPKGIFKNEFYKKEVVTNG